MIFISHRSQLLRGCSKAWGELLNGCQPGVAVLKAWLALGELFAVDVGPGIWLVGIGLQALVDGTARTR